MRRDPLTRFQIEVLRAVLHADKPLLAIHGEIDDLCDLALRAIDAECSAGPQDNAVSK